MRRIILGALSVFASGVIAGYSGTLILLQHVREPLAQSVHFAWYDWFMYVAYPGSMVSMLYWNVFSPEMPERTVAVIALTNGLVFAFIWIVLVLSKYSLLPKLKQHRS